MICDRLSLAKSSQLIVQTATFSEIRQEFLLQPEEVMRVHKTPSHTVGQFCS